MEKKSLTEIVQETANRYGLKYDENQTEMKVELKDGNIRTVTKEDFQKAFEQNNIKRRS